MATKTKDGRYPVINEMRGNSCASPVEWTGSNLVGPTEKWTAVFHRPKPKQLGVTPLTYEEAVTFEAKTSSCKKHSGGTSYRSGTYYFCHNALAGTNYSYDSRPSLSMATTLAKARFTSNNYAETLAESRQTARMIGGKIGILSSLAKAIRARDRVKADKVVARIRGEQYSYQNTQGKPISRRFSDGWLEYQFGWLPLLSDIHDAVGYYNNRLHRGMQVSRSYTTNGGFAQNARNTPSQRAERTRLYGPAAKAVIRTRVANPTLRTLSEMGLTNPLSLAWDLLPYSFVVDWVTPISSILKSLLYEVGLSEDGSYSVTEHGSYNLKNPSCCGQFTTSYKRVVIRQPLGIGTPPDIFTNPRDMGLWHIVTSTALLRQQFKGGRY